MGTLVLQPGVNTLTFRVNPLKRGLYALKGVQARVGRAAVTVPVEPQRQDFGRAQRLQQSSASDAGAIALDVPASAVGFSVYMTMARV